MSGLWQVVGGVIGAVVLVIWAITIWDIFRSRLGAAKTAAWLLIVILLPLVGSAVYWIRRKPQAGDVQRLYDNEAALRESRARRPAGSSTFGP
jgi:hypothetical protein